MKLVQEMLVPASVSAADVSASDLASSELDALSDLLAARPALSSCEGALQSEESDAVVRRRLSCCPSTRKSC